MDQALLTLINQLTVAAVCALGAWLLWKRMTAQDDKHSAEMKAANDAHQKDLREFNSGVLYDLKARIMVAEDMLKIDRSERTKYLPPMSQEAQEALLNMDANK